ncbi:DUF3558 family protein [Micrococcus luteus]
MLRIGIIAVAATVVSILGGCSSELTGVANPQPSSDATADDRPVLEPCALIADATMRTFELSAPAPEENPVIPGSRQCSWRSSKSKGNYHLVSLPPRYTLESVNSGYDDPRPGVVAGHNSLETYFSEARKDQECILFVEISAKSLLAFQFEPHDRSRTTTHESLCGTVRNFADSVVAVM